MNELNTEELSDLKKYVSNIKYDISDLEKLDKLREKVSGLFKNGYISTI